MKLLPAILILVTLLPNQHLLAQLNFEKGDSIRTFSKSALSAIQSEIDSLKYALNFEQPDTAKVNGLNRLTELYNKFNADSAVRYGTAAQVLAEKTKDRFRLSKALMNLGVTAEVYRKDWNMAILYYKKAIELIENTSKYPELHTYYSTILNSYFYLGDFSNAMIIATKGLSSAEEQKDPEMIFRYDNLIAAINFRLGNYPESKKYYQQSLQRADRLNNDTERVFANLGLADIYIAEKDATSAFSRLFQAFDIANKTFDKPSHIYKHKIPYILNRIGYAYKTFGNTAKALEYTLAALDYTNRVSCDKFDIATYYLQAGDIYRQLHDYLHSKEYLYKGLTIAAEIGHKEDTRDAYDFLFQIYAAENKFDSAYLYHKLYTELKDSIVNETSRRNIAQIQGQYDVAKKDKEIARQAQFRNNLIGSFIFLLISLWFIYSRYQLRQKNKHQEEQNRQQNELFNAIATAQDQERKRIAQDIHDSLGSVLSAARLKLSLLKETETQLTPDRSESFQMTLQLLDEASVELRNISHNIMPGALSKLGLVAALKNLINTIHSSTRLQIDFSAYDMEKRLEEFMEISIYRIVLELINNIVKHASASKATVQLIRYPEHLNITIEDNGKGFDYTLALQEKRGIGLGNIISRVHFLNGTMDVDTLPGRGTAVIIDVPLKNTDS